MGVVRTGFVEVYNQPPEVVFPENDLVILLLSSAIIAFYVFFLLFLATWDRHEIKKSRLARLNKDKAPRTVDSLLDKVVPGEFRSGRWYKLLASRSFWSILALSFAPYNRRENIAASKFLCFQSPYYCFGFQHCHN